MKTILSIISIAVALIAIFLIIKLVVSRGADAKGKKGKKSAGSSHDSDPAPAKIKPNRYRRDKKTESTPRDREPILSSSLLDDMEVDRVLGVKRPEPAPKAVDPKQAEQAPIAEREVLEPVEVPEVYMVSLKAEANKPYSGYELLQALLASGLRYGEQNIFHRHEHKNGQGKILFSLASMVKPGTFDLTRMGEVRCPGLTLFMQPPQVEQPLIAYQLLIETARQLIDDLGGEMWDEKREALTPEVVNANYEHLTAYAKYRLQLERQIVES